jgi:hypothetical protein
MKREHRTRMAIVELGTGAHERNVYAGSTEASEKPQY